MSGSASRESDLRQLSYPEEVLGHGKWVLKGERGAGKGFRVEELEGEMSDISGPHWALAPSLGNRFLILKCSSLKPSRPNPALQHPGHK